MRFNCTIIVLFCCFFNLNAQDSIKLNSFGYSDDYIPNWDYSFLRKTALDFISRGMALEQRSFDLTKYYDAQRDKLQAAQLGLDLSEITLNQGENIVINLYNNMTKSSYEITKLKKQKEHLKLKIENFRKVYPQAINFNLDTFINEKVKICRAQEQKYNSSVGIGSNKLELACSNPDYVLQSYENKVYNGSSSSWNVSFGIGGSNSAGNGSGSLGFGFGGSKSGSRLHNLNSYQQQFRDMLVNLEEIHYAILTTELTYKNDSILYDNAILERYKNHLVYQDAQKRVDSLQSGILSINTINNLGKIVDTLVTKYLKFSTGLAWLTQRAYEIEYVDDVDYIKSNYENQKKWLRSDILLFNLDEIENKRITQKNKRETNSYHLISLRKHDILDFINFTKTGDLDFILSEHDLDMLYPGSYRRLIESIEVDIIGLSDITGYKGYLKKGNVSSIRVPDIFFEKYSSPDWMTFELSGYSILPIRSENDFMMLPKYSNDRNSEGEKRPFEGSGVAGLYSLHLDRNGNNSLNRIVDVVIRLNFSCYFDEGLEVAIEKELCKRQELGLLQLGSTASYSLREDAVDPNFDFFNTYREDSALDTVRFIPFLVRKGDYSENEYDHDLQSVRLCFFGDTSLIPVNASITTQKMNPGISFSYEDANLIFDDGKFGYKDLAWFPDNFPSDSFPYSKQDNIKKVFIRKTDNLNKYKAKLFDLWVIKIESGKNPEFTVNGRFDNDKLAKINDVTLNFEYGYTKRFCNSDYSETFGFFVDSIVHGYPCKDENDVVSEDNSKEMPYYIYENKINKMYYGHFPADPEDIPFCAFTSITGKVVSNPQINGFSFYPVKGGGSYYVTLPKYLAERYLSFDLDLSSFTGVFLNGISNNILTIFYNENGYNLNLMDSNKKVILNKILPKKNVPIQIAFKRARIKNSKEYYLAIYVEGERIGVGKGEIFDGMGFVEPDGSFTISNLRFNKF